MTSRLTDVRANVSFTPGGRRAPTRQMPSEFTPQAPVDIATQAINTIPDLTYLVNNIPNIRTYVTPELIPDILYMFRYYGVLSYLKAMHGADGNLSVKEPMIVFKTMGFPAFVQNMVETYGLQQNSVVESVNGYGLTQMREIVGLADPDNPASIVFVQPDQNGHRATEKVEMEIIRGDADMVVERIDIACTCGSRRVTTMFMQTRSGDEAQTVSARCHNCARVWRFSAA